MPMRLYLGQIPAPEEQQAEKTHDTGSRRISIHADTNPAHGRAMIRLWFLFLALLSGLHAAPIKELEFLKWMEGTWVHESEGTTVRMKSRWLDDGRFLERSFEIQLGKEPLRKMRQTVYWDPAEKEVRSLGTYSDGTFETGIWRMKDGTLEIRREITYPDGTRGKATNLWTPIDPKNCAWSSVKRTMGRKKMPDIPTTSLQKD